MEEKKNALTVWKTIAIFAIIAAIVMTTLFCVTVTKSPKAGAQGETATPINADPQVISDTAGDPLSLWTNGSEAKEKLLDFVKDVTDEKSPNYIPPEKRIAVSDMDGTLFGETNPIYFDHSLLLYRVLQDPDYKDKASDFEKETCYRILEGIRAGQYPEGMDTMHGQAVASAFKGMTVGEFVDYCKTFREQQAPGYDNLQRKNEFYKPMMQMINYLEENGFTFYIVSGTDRLILRGITEDNLNLPLVQVIGSDETIVASGQGDTPGLDYTFTDQDKLILGGDFVTKNLKMNKVAVIAQEIGEQPVLSFGNSTGDSSMAEYVTTNNPYRSLAFMNCCDDLDREYGNEEKAQTMDGLCKQYGWTPVSMKNDWVTIYGEDVTKNPENGLSFYYDYEIPEDRPMASYQATNTDEAATPDTKPEEFAS